jgi:hypothetical protein
MPLRGAYAPTLPEFDSFLFASVGEEVDGVPLSVLSALSRLDLDPRDEAARLSHLTKETEARRVSDRLVERLPTSTGADKPDRFDTGAAPTPRSEPSQFLVYLALLIALVVGLFANGLLSL